MDYEGALISKVLTDGAFPKVVDERVKNELFVSYPLLWSHIVDTFSKHGGVPPVEMVENSFPDFRIQNAADIPVSLLVDELRKRHVHNLITGSMREQADFLKGKDPYSALKLMRETVLKADIDTRPSFDLNFVEDIAERKDRYDEAASSSGITGIPSPWACLDELTQGFHSEDLIMIAGRGGTGKCIDAESRIVNPVTGVENTIREVVEGDQLGIHTWDEENGITSSLIEAKVDTGTKRCFRYLLESGRSITVTPEHPFLTPEGWVRADCLDAGDAVGLPKDIPEPMRPVEMPISTVRFLALLLTEGSYTGNHVGFSTTDFRMIVIAEDFVRGTPSKVVPRGGYDYDVSVGSVGGHTPNPARTLLRELGIDRTLAKHKSIPDVVYTLPNSQLAEFLAVFWMADGYVSTLGVPGITLASERMVEQLQHLLLRFGIQSSVHHKPIKGGFESWRLRVYAHCVPSFHASFSLWGDKGARLNSRVRLMEKTTPNPNVGGPRWRTPKGWDLDKKGVHWDRIKEVFDAGERKIYDLTVSKTHNFIANDIIVHNTWAELILAWFNWSQGYIPLVFSREMAVWQIARRLDAVNAKLPYQRFKSGMLTSEEKDRWDAALEHMKGGRPFWITGDDGDGHLGVTAITAKVHRYRPHIVYIDGAYLIQDDREGKQQWQQFYNVCQDLKRLAQREKIPVVVTHQFSAAGKGEDGNADTLKFGDVQMWFDLIIGCYRDEAMRASNEMLFKINKQREGGNLNWVAEWDLVKMAFDTKPGEDDLRESDTPYEEEKPVKF